MPSMSLTTSLALLGAAVLVALLVHGWWQARRSGPRRADPGPAVAERVEPAMGDSPSPAGTDGVDAAPRVPVVRRSFRLDALVDAIVPIALEAPVAGELVVGHLPPSRRAGSKPLAVEGLNAVTGEWETPAHGQTYSEFQAGVQLANRIGALNEIEYSEFVQKIQVFADAVMELVRTA